MINGVSIERNKFATVCRIDYFSNELKTEIRNRLSAICHGPDAVSKKSIFSSYKYTIKEFNKRYRSKSENIKKGWIGELLTHLLLIKTRPNFEPASPFFNMEEGSSKKGFDLVVFDNKLNQIWISEVKSGSAGKNNADNVNRSLLNTAKNDLKTRLGENETNLWHNAINGAKVALSSGNVKNRINQILEECYQEAADEDQDGSSKNVILISVTYKSSTVDPITFEKVKKKGKKISDEKLFRDVIVFSIQKETYDRVAEFLEAEAE
jgi:hypothetical protein